MECLYAAPLGGARKTRCATPPFIPNFSFPLQIWSGARGTKQKSGLFVRARKLFAGWDFLLEATAGFAYGEECVRPPGRARLETFSRTGNKPPALGLLTCRGCCAMRMPGSQRTVERLV